MSGKSETMNVVDLCADESNLGKELAQAHALYCALRYQGFNADDIGKLVKADPTLWAHTLALIRGVVPLGNLSSELVNLDKHPGIKRDRLKKTNLFRDLRLGVWLSDWTGDGIKIGDHYVDIIRPQGWGVQNSKFFDRLTLNPDPHQKEKVIDLNSQAAAWFYEEHSDAARNFFELTGQIAKSDEWKDDKIFFLGTLWTVNEMPYAMALVSNTDGLVHCRPEPLPVGKWPENCYIAVLVKDPTSLKRYK